MAGATCSPYPFRSDLPPKCSDSTLITISHMSAGSNRPPQAPRIYWYNQPSYKKFGVSHQKLGRLLFFARSPLAVAAQTTGTNERPAIDYGRRTTDY